MEAPAPMMTGACHSFEAADAIAETALHGDLQRAAEAGDERERRCDFRRAHGVTLYAQLSRGRSKVERMPEVLTARAGDVLTITLNRPEVYNAFDRALHGALRVSARGGIGRRSSRRGDHGRGRGFCAARI